MHILLQNVYNVMIYKLHQLKGILLIIKKKTDQSRYIMDPNLYYYLFEDRC